MVCYLTGLLGKLGSVSDSFTERIPRSTFSEGFTLNMNRSIANCRNERIRQSPIFSNCGFYTLLVTCCVLLYVSCCGGKFSRVKKKKRVFSEVHLNTTHPYLPSSLLPSACYSWWVSLSSHYWKLNLLKQWGTTVGMKVYPSEENDAGECSSLSDSGVGDAAQSARAVPPSVSAAARRLRAAAAALLTAKG